MNDVNADGVKSSAQSSVGLTAQLEKAGVGSARVSATGLWAGALLVGATLLGMLLWGDFTKPQHFMATLLLAWVAGMFAAAAMLMGRVAEALAFAEHYRLEVKAQSERQRVLEEKLLTHRLSSLPESSSSNPTAPQRLAQ